MARSRRTAWASNCEAVEQRSFQGVVPGYDGFVVKHSDANARLKMDRRNEDVVRPYMTGNDMVTKGCPGRSIIDFASMPQFDARKYDAPFAAMQLFSVHQTV